MKTIGLLFDDRKIERLGLESRMGVFNNGLKFVKINHHLPIDSQGPFDVIIHKLNDFEDQGRALYPKLQTFLAQHPEVKCIDPLHFVNAIADRYDQNNLLSSSLGQSTLANAVFVPPFCLAERNDSEATLRLMAEHDIRFPIICKKLSTQGEPSTRKMALVFNARGLQALDYPIVLQQFINHDARLFKLFVIGDFVYIRLRPSIQNFSPSNQETIFFQSSTISKEDSASPLNVTEAIDKEHANLSIDQRNMLIQIARQLRFDLKLDLFGVDVVKCSEQFHPVSIGASGDAYERTNFRFAVVDLNPVPGYSGVPNFPQHLENLIREKLSLSTLSVSTEDIL